MVKNVSESVNTQQIREMGLTPCKICNPTTINGINISYPPINTLGKTKQSYQCNGITKRGTRCKHHTHIANGYCYQHKNQKKK